MIHLIAIAQFTQSHILAILLCILATYFIGFTWHGPLFGKAWMAANKIPMPKKEDMKFSMMLPGLAANFVMVFVQASVMGRTFQIVQLDNIGHALIIAVILWLPFTMLPIINNNAWLGKSWKVTALDAGYNLASMLAIAAIMYAML